jgi:N-acetylneuraminic acid mutarotase
LSFQRSDCFFADFFKQYKGKVHLIPKEACGGSSINKHIQILIAMLIIVTIVLPAFNFPITKAQATEDHSSWTTMTPMPTARGGLGVATVNGKIYAIGGLSGDSPVNVNEMYDPGTNMWTTETPMPTARSGCAVAVYDGKIYVIGGEIGNWYVGNNEVYDPGTNTWKTEASMPAPRSDLSASVVNGKIYLIGGKEYSSTNPYYSETDVNEIYEPANNTWTTGTPIPTAVYGYASTVIDGKIHIIGGSQASSSQGSNIFVNSNQVYDPQTDTWSLGANLPSAVTYGAAAATEGFMAPSLLYVIGGYFLNSFSSNVQVYNPGNNSWSTGASMPTARAYLGVAVVNDVLYAIGGFDGQNWLNTVEEYTPIGYGTAPPIIQITSPENETYNKVTLNFTVNRDTEWMGYSLDNQANVTLMGKTELLILSQGAHNIILYGNDSSGNMGSSNRVFFSVDTIAPDIVIMLPQNQSYGSTDIQLTFEVNKTVTWLAYSLDGQQNVTIIGNVTLPALSNGSHRLIVYATDEVGNTGSKTVYFNIAPFPTITVVGVAATITIALAAGYLLFEHRKSSNKKKE